VAAEALPGDMNGDINSAPVMPPPGPGTPSVYPPGAGSAGPGCSPQHAVESPTDSSKLITSRPSFLNAGEFRIRGTQTPRNASACLSAYWSSMIGFDGSGPVQLSCASSHWSGTM
jgi:hypothetical protein